MMSKPMAQNSVIFEGSFQPKLFYDSFSDKTDKAKKEKLTFWLPFPI